MNPVPHIGRTLTQRRAHPGASYHPSIRAYQQNQRAHYEGQVEQLRELERFEQTDAALQVDALIERARSAGQLVPEESEHPWWRDVTCWTAALFVMAGFGILLRDPVARLLVVLGVLQ